MSNEYERTPARSETVADAAYDETLADSGASEYTPGTVSSYGTGTSYGTEQSGSTTDVAKDQAKQVGQEAVQTGQHVAGVAKDQAKTVASEAGTQAKNLLGEARTQLTDQLSTQQGNLATWVRDLGQELTAMVDRDSTSQAPSGTATTLARQASGRAQSMASWLENREPADVLQEVTRFARRRPGAFLAIAALGGLLAGRLTRGLTSDSSDSSDTTGYAGGSAQGYRAQPLTAGTPVAGSSGTWTAPDDEYLGATTTTGYPTGQAPVVASTDPAWAADEGVADDVASPYNQQR
jgi:hypothetical protein